MYGVAYGVAAYLTGKLLNPLWEQDVAGSNPVAPTIPRLVPSREPRVTSLWALFASLLCFLGLRIPHVQEGARSSVG